MTQFTGACHCKRVRIRFVTGFTAAELPLRRCACSFCRKHGARTATDPGGQVTLYADEANLARYRFGFKAADYLLCRGCGMYVAAAMETPEGLFATLNVNLLDDEAAFDPLPSLVSYDEEPAEARAQRRRARWTPLVLTALEADA